MKSLKQSKKPSLMLEMALHKDTQKRVPVLLVDAFTTTPGKGNRAGVVLDATGLSADEMQAIAALVNVSETAFMIPTPDREDYELQVRYFTPSTEVPICGHATIASHFARTEKLGIDNGRFTAKVGAGILPVDVMTIENEKKVIMTQGEIKASPLYDDEINAEILSALGLDLDDTITQLPIQEVSTGHSKVMVPIKSVEKLDSLTPDMPALVAASEKIDCNGFFVFAFNGPKDDCLTSGRMFAPAIGIDEDPVTGNGNGPCGAYLSYYGILPPDSVYTYQGRQGVAMGKEGVMEVTVQRGEEGPKTVLVAGTAVIAEEMVVEISDKEVQVKFVDE